MSVRLALVLITLISILSSLPAFAARERADTVLLNASVHTMDAARSIKEAVCIAGDRIIYVGSNKGARRFIEKATKVLDLKGRMVLPGFQDCHVHLVEGGMHLNECNLDDLKSVDEVVDMINLHS